MTEADAIVLGSPTYSADVSSTLKAVIERASVVSDTNPGMIAYGRLPGEALKDEEAVTNMKNLGQNIAWLLNRFK